MPGWDGKRTERQAQRGIVCAGCGELPHYWTPDKRYHRSGPLVRVGDYLIHDSAACRLRHIRRLAALKEQSEPGLHLPLEAIV